MKDAEKEYATAQKAQISLPWSLLGDDGRRDGDCSAIKCNYDYKNCEA